MSKVAVFRFKATEMSPIPTFNRMILDDDIIVVAFVNVIHEPYSLTLDAFIQLLLSSSIELNRKEKKRSEHLMTAQKTL